MPPHGYGVGRLKMMTPKERETVIKTMTRKVKLKLIQLATFGLQKQLEQVDLYNQIIRDLTREYEEES